MSDLRDAIVHIFDTAADPFGALWNWAKEPDQEDRRHERWNALERWAGSHKRGGHDDDEEKAWRHRQRVYRKRARGTRPNPDDDVPPIDNGWHPEARRVGVVGGIGSFRTPHRIVWHTTEGFGLPTYAGSNPHFTLDHVNGILYQHQPVTDGARALVNAPGGVETNSQGAIQIELIGFASQSQNWSEQSYANIAELARWIELHCGVKRESHVTFVGGGSTNHMSSADWLAYNGHCGHQHVPENTHWDPGLLQIAKVLDK